MGSFIGEIRAFPYTFVPEGWLECYGQTVYIQQYTALFSLIGTLYGGDGRSTFMLPDLRSNALVGAGISPVSGVPYVRGQKYGGSTATITYKTMAAHNHSFVGKTGATTLRESSPRNDNSSYLTNIGYKKTGGAAFVAALAYLDPSQAPVFLQEDTITPSLGNPAQGGKADPHGNCSPFLAVRYCICADDGDYPMPS